MGSHAFWNVQCSNDFPADDEQDFKRRFTRVRYILYLDEICIYMRALKEHMEHMCDEYSLVIIHYQTLYMLSLLI
jgi:hypothetical protein